MLQKLRSQYILKKIFDYIKDDLFEYKLFKLSKLFQKRLNLSLDDYKLSFLKKINLNLNSYFHKENNLTDKTFLKKKLNDDLTSYNIDIKILEIYITNYYKDKYENQNENIILDINSPFFDFLLKKEFSEKICTIPICVYHIKKCNLKTEYISKFDELNKSNVKYSSISFKFIRNNDIDYLKEMNINYKQIKKF